MIVRRVRRFHAGTTLGLALLGLGAAGVDTGCAHKVNSASDGAHGHDRAIACVTPVPPDPATDKGKRIAWLTKSIDAALTRTTAPATSGDLARAALASVVLHQDGRSAQQLLEPLLAREVMDTSDARGTFVMTGATDQMPAHELETVALPLVPFLTTFKHCVTASAQTNLETGLRETIGALRKDAARHKVGSTRAFLEASVSLAAMGEALGDVAAARQGQEQIDEWVRTTALHGVTEYDAPDDSTAALEALTFGNLYISDEATRANCHRGVLLLWNDFAAHWFPAQDRMVGPSSRKTDSAVDGVRMLAALAGWSDPPEGDVALGHVTSLLAALDTGYLPDDDTRALFTVDERVVTSGWSDPDHPEPGHETYLWTSKDVAIGATSARAPRAPGALQTVGNTDRPVDVELATAGAAPLEITAHVGARPLPILTTASQDRGAMLLLVSAPWYTPGTDTPGAAPPAPTPSPTSSADELSTELTLPMPAEGELAVDGRRSGGAQLSIGAVLGVRAGAGGYAIQIASAQGCHVTPRIELQADPVAKLAHVRIVHGDGSKLCRPRVVLSIAAGKASSHAELAALMDSARATVTERTADMRSEAKPKPAGDKAAQPATELTSWSASTRIERGTWKGVSLSVERRETKKPNDKGEPDLVVVNRKSGGKPMVFSVLSENGKDLSVVLANPAHTP